MLKKIIITGIGVAITALYFIPQLQPAWLNWWPAYNSATADAATTISGILAPTLSLATLAVVYFTFGEQVRANRVQLELLQTQQKDVERQRIEFQTTTNRQNNEAFFNLTFRMVEQFSEAVERQQRLFIEVPEISLGIYRGSRVTSSDSMGGSRPARQDELVSYQRNFFVLTQFFDVIRCRFDGERLTGEQKLVFLDLLDVGYGARVRTAVIEHQQQIGDSILRQNRDEMYLQLEEQDILLFRLRKAAETQVGIESIPFGDPESIENKLAVV